MRISHLSLLLGSALLAACAGTQSTAGLDPFETLQGTWGRKSGAESCETGPHTISFSEDRTRLIMARTAAEGAGGADVSDKVQFLVTGSGENYVRIIDQEVAAKPGYKRGSYDLMVRSADRYCWRPTRRRQVDCDLPYYRCE